jgi:hypothetical protein
VSRLRWQGPGWGDGPACVGLHWLRAPDVGDHRHHDARDAAAVTDAVLGAYLVSTFHSGFSAKQLQRQLGIGCVGPRGRCCTSSGGAMVAPEGELLKREVEIDEFCLGGYEEGLKGSRQRGKEDALRNRARGPRPRFRPTGPPSPVRPLGRFAAGVHTDGYQALQRPAQAPL